jgi:RNA 2',3'-cyclic 3'-phosphodiesterase
LFVAVWPDAATVGLLSSLPRPALPGVRWARPEQWHVTLRFLGDAEPGAVASRLGSALPAGPAVRAEMGPACARLGRGVLQVPVAGLEDLAGAVVEVTPDLGQPPRPGPFHGHLTLARARRPEDLRSLVGRPASSSWPVQQLTLVSSATGRTGSRYEVVGRWDLGVAGS